MDCRVCGGDGYIVTEVGDGESGPSVDMTLCDECSWGQSLIARGFIKDHLRPSAVLVPSETDIPLVVEGILNVWERDSGEIRDWVGVRDKWTVIVTATVAYLRSDVGRAETLYRIWQEKVKVADEAHDHYLQRVRLLLGPDERVDLARACERYIPEFK